MPNNSFAQKLLAPLRDSKVQKLFFWTIGGSLFFAIYAVFTRYSIKRILDSIEQKNMQLFIHIMILIGIVYIIRFAISYILRLKKRKFENTVQNYLYVKYLSRYFHMDNNIVENLGTGKSNSILQRGCDLRKKFLSDLSDQCTQTFFSIVFGLIVLGITTDVTTVLLTIGFLSIAILIARHGNKKITPVRRAKRDVYTRMDSDIVRIIMSKFEVLRNSKISYEIEKIISGFKQVESFFKKEVGLFTYVWDGQIFVINMATFCALGYVGYGALHGQYTIADIALIGMVLQMISSSISQTFPLIVGFHQMSIFVEKLRDTFDDAPTIPGYTTGKTFTFKKGDITIDHITYTYHTGKDKTEAVFTDFSISIQGGKKTALVGPSGSGKSTLVKLIAGYIHTNTGTIMVDNQLLPSINTTDHVSLQSYYKHIGYLTQEPSVFDGTIKENLLYGTTKNIEEKDIEKALDLAECDFVDTFTDGLETIIGEKGVRLSGGQRQRLAIAKIFLKNPEILILDEPTSALDSMSEQKISHALHTLFEGRTVIIIAHRLQTVKQADDIIVLEQGKDGTTTIIERGTHETLIQKKSGYYREMVELQSGF